MERIICRIYCFTVLSFVKALKETAFLKITDEQKVQITEILSKQKWTSGKCGHRKVNAYFNFHIENVKFEKPEEGKH